MHILLLSGGDSSERAVSLRSGAAVKRALLANGHTVTDFDPSAASSDELLRAAHATDATFPILHGAGGEDGVLQKQLETARVSFFGPSSVACEATYDKAVFKKILEAHNINTPKWALVRPDSFANEQLTSSPFVLKPISGGSSIDTFIVRDPTKVPPELFDALRRHKEMLIEELIDGAEITVGVLNNEALPVVEIIPPKDQEFDYENKYNGATQELCPPENISAGVQTRAQALAVEVHAITQCRHLSRTDMMIDADGELYVIDTNTIPGLTDQSLYPKAASAAGYSWKKLIDTFLTYI